MSDSEEEGEIIKPKHHIFKPPYNSVKDIGFSETQGRRDSMEDSFCVVDNFQKKKYKGFFGIYDGHGGRTAVEYVHENLHKNFSKELTRSKNPKRSFWWAYKKTDCDMKDIDCQECGTTAINCYINLRKKRLYVANAGDSRVVLCRKKNVAQRLTYDHKSSDENEIRRINSASGFVLWGRVCGAFTVSRALGDHGYKKWIVSDPFYCEIKLKKSDKFIIMACDGVWDVMDDQEAVDLIKDLNSAQEMSNLLMEKALKRGSRDNISAMVLILKEVVKKKKKKIGVLMKSKSLRKDWKSKSTKNHFVL